ncbi:MAG: GTP cyclohydrolase IIa [Candidatus Hadarchaeia archaeon]
MSEKKKIQITLAQLDNYGPWTVEPEPKPEAYLQMIQTRLFADIEEGFSEKGALAFMTRFDNTLIVSNGVSKKHHRKVQRRIGEKYPVTVSFGIGSAVTAYEAQKLASRALQRKGSAQSEERSEEVVGKGLSFPEESSVQIAHIDIDHATGFTDSDPIFDTHLLIQKVYLTLSNLFVKEDSLVFYTGGDNYMAPCNGLGKEDIEKILRLTEDRTGIDLKAGVGIAEEPTASAFRASEALHMIRDNETEGDVYLKTSD